MKTVSNDPYFENSRLVLINNTLTLKEENISVRLSALQNKLLWCLVRDITDRQDIIREIWPDAIWNSKGNNYKQLTFQTKEKLYRSGFPNEILITSPKKGICINENFLRPIITKKKLSNIFFKDPGVFIYL